MWRCSRIMHMQRELHPTLLSSLEGIVDQMVWFRENWHEEVRGGAVCAEGVGPGALSGVACAHELPARACLWVGSLTEPQRLHVCTLVPSSPPKQKTSNEGDIKKAVAAFKMLLLFTCLNLTAEIPSLAKEQRDVG